MSCWHFLSVSTVFCSYIQQVAVNLQLIDNVHLWGKQLLRPDRELANSFAFDLWRNMMFSRFGSA